MTIRVELPDGSMAEFPDGTPHSVMERALQDHFASQPQASPPEMSWSDVPGQALANAPGSAYEFGKAMAYPFMHPIDTLQNMVDLPSGAIREGARAVLPEQTFNNYDEYLFGPKDVAERSSETAKAVGGFYANRYG